MGTGGDMRAERCGPVGAAAGLVEPLEPRRLYAAAARGGLDLSFGGGDGFVDLPLGHNVALSGSAVAPDGKIVVCGYTKPRAQALDFSGYSPSRDFFLARLNPDGTLDTTFGADGTGVIVANPSRAHHGRSENEEAAAVAVQPDGKILLTGVIPNNSDFRSALARYNVDGTPDPTFFSPPIFGLGMPAIPISAQALAVDASGAIYAAGMRDGFPSFGVVRVNPDGTVHPAFANSGLTFGAEGSGARAVVVLPDGRVILAGRGSRETRLGYRYVTGMGVVALLPGGGRDESFGWVPSGRRGSVPPAGITFLPPQRFGGGATDMTVGPDGKIVVAGTDVVSARVVGTIDYPRFEATASAFWVARLNANGTPDASFGRGGSARVRAGVFGVATDVAVTSWGGVVAAGMTARTAGEVADNRYGYAVARFASNGKPEKTFGRKGVLNLPIPVPADAWPDNIVPTEPARLLASPERAVLATDPAGNTLVLAAANSRLYVARLTAPGVAGGVPGGVASPGSPDLVPLSAGTGARPGSAELRPMVIVRNIGTGTAAGRITVRLLASDDNVFDANDILLGEATTAVRIAPGRLKRVRLNFIPPGASGGQTLIVQVDVGNAVQESNEENNTMAVGTLQI